MRSNIFITGFSGSGKTTVAVEVARRLGWRLVDTDDEIAKIAGRTIADIFAGVGESEFRRMEHACLASLCGGERQVVSTGGGIAMDEPNRKLMEQHGIVVLLEARPETIYERLDRQGMSGEGPVARPMLDSSDPLRRISSLKAERQVNYNSGSLDRSH